MSNLLWVALPYVAFTTLIVGTAYSYWKDERYWTTKSSEFLAKGSLKFAGPMFHLGLAMAFGGHVIGILIPKSLTDGVGISEHLYHIIALGGGIPAGILFLGGFFLLMRRRFDNPAHEGQYFDNGRRDLHGLIPDDCDGLRRHVA